MFLKYLLKKGLCNSNLFHVTWKRSIRLSSCKNDKISYIHHIGKSPLLYKTIGQITELASEKFPDRQAIVSCYENRKLTFQQLLEQADKLAAGLTSLGLRKGDRLAILSPNNIEWTIIFIAAARLGVISVLLNPAYQATELEYCLKKVDVSGIITVEAFKTQQYYDMLSTIIPEMKMSQVGKINCSKIPSLKVIGMITKKNLPGIFKYDDIIDLATNKLIAEVRDLQSSIPADFPFNIQFTSGTTGKPKAALLSHFNFVNNAKHIGFRNELDNKYHRICVQVPFFHAYGTVATILPSILYGATLVLPAPSFNATESLRAINVENCTIIHGTPTMYVDLLNRIKELNYRITTPEIAVTGGAPCSPQLFQNMLKYLNVKKVKSIFGMTETTAVIFQSQTNDNEYYSTQTVGHLTDHVEAKVIDTDGRTVPFGTPGELLVRGYCNMLGYWDDEDKTKEMIGPDRWLRTGDQFILEENGYGRIVGRLKDMIIRGGENIFPKEIEEFFCTHPDVVENYVFGIADGRLGEEVCACVKVHENSNLTIEDLKSFCKGKIAHFKIPKHIRIVKHFPMTASGKIQKFKLKEMVESEMNGN